MDGKAGEADGLLTGFAARLAKRLDACMSAFKTKEAEAPNVEKDAKAIAALGRAAIIVHTLKAAEDKALDIPAHRPACNDNYREGDEMEPDERGHTGRPYEDMAALRAEVERRFERLARSFEQKGRLPDGVGPDDPPDDGLLARAGEARSDPALE